MRRLRRKWRRPPHGILGVLMRTDLLCSRALAHSDADVNYAIMNDREAMRFCNWPAISDAGPMIQILAQQSAEVAGCRALYWAVARKAEGSPIGNCDLSEIDHHHRRAKMGFLFHRAWLRHGLARKAAAAVVKFAFGPLALERLWGRSRAGDVGVQALLESLEFAQEATLRGRIWREGVRRDNMIFGRSRA